MTCQLQGGLAITHFVRATFCFIHNRRVTQQPDSGLEACIGLLTDT